MGVDTKKNEGFRSRIYRDSRGVKTIGYGFNLEDKVTRALLPDAVAKGNRAITKKEAEDAFSKRMSIAIKDAKNFVGEDIYNQLDSERQAVLDDMSYNLGLPKLKKFKKFKKALVSGDFDKAADEMVNSRWHKQTGNRAKSLVQKMRAGTEQEELLNNLLGQLR